MQLGEEPIRLRILLSYWYYKDTDLDALFAKYFVRPYPEVFADSGAFSALTQGSRITIEQYAGWIARWGHLFTTYANLDVITDAEATWENQRRLEDLGLTPLPAFHVLEDFHWLERYVDRYPYIALGVAGMQKRTDAVMRWVTRCFQVAGDSAVFHGFALTSWTIMRTFRWYSVDSSSWGSGFRFGQVPIFDERRGGFVKLTLGDRKAWLRYAGLLADLGFDWADFADRGRNDRAKICALSALSYIRAEQYLRKRHGVIQLPSGGPAVSGGVKVHLADARGHSGSDIGAAADGLRMYLVDSPYSPARDTGYVQAALCK